MPVNRLVALLLVRDLGLKAARCPEPRGALNLVNAGEAAAKILGSPKGVDSGWPEFKSGSENARRGFWTPLRCSLGGISRHNRSSPKNLHPEKRHVVVLHLATRPKPRQPGQKNPGLPPSPSLLGCATAPLLAPARARTSTTTRRHQIEGGVIGGNSPPCFAPRPGRAPPHCLQPYCTAGPDCSRIRSSPKRPRHHNFSALDLKQAAVTNRDRSPAQRRTCPPSCFDNLQPEQRREGPHVRLFPRHTTATADAALSSPTSPEAALNPRPLIGRRCDHAQSHEPTG